MGDNLYFTRTIKEKSIITRIIACTRHGIIIIHNKMLVER